MCGIAGIGGMKDTHAAGSAIRRMTDRIAHRGPDADGFLIEDGVALGHRRLSIIDLSEAANQPQFDVNDRYAIILNGEIYNYRDVKAKLPDYPYKTESDTEAIIAAYSALGPACLELLNGMFAIAIWDRQRHELFVARDRLGVKPLYYSITSDGVFVFASEIRAILESGLVERKLDGEALSEYLMYQSVYAPRTIVENVSQLPAGTYGIYTDSKLSIKPFWEIETRSTEFDYSDKDAVKRTVRELLLGSVERRMISDVRLGAFLSGGIDSSGVVGLMSEVSDQPVDTFSVTFREEEFDESHYSNLIAKKFNTRHTAVELSPKDFLDEMPNALAAVDSPTGDGFNTYVVSKATKRAGITVALSGLGGDELFAGYPYFFNWLDMQKGLLPKLPRLLRRPLSAAFATSSRSKYQRIADILGAETLDLAGVYPMFRQVMSRQTARDYFQNGNGRTSLEKQLEEKRDAVAQFPLLSQISIAEMIGYTQNVLLKDTDQFAMASALEVREPYFDYLLVEYVLGIPDSIKLPKYPKSLLVESIAPLLPDEIVHRPKKGFVLPFEQWMKNEMKELCESRLRYLDERGIFAAGQLNRKWKAFQTGADGVRWSELWHLVVLADWLETNGF
ncbi:MAG TPA: asparagine synthase (glutamine-hydrolyzing) [Pyrinomonadaceae bacterium]|nr:asparagine synthase (glutamine-hydrolyzing) [Pyrinomonadaceae bacterium]